MRYSLLLLMVCGLYQVQAQLQKKVEAFALADVELLDSPFKRAEQTNVAYILTMDPDRLLSPFLREAGLLPKAESYGNWENTGLDGHIGGHYLSALSLAAAATGDPAVQERLTYMIDELKRCQDANGDGYLGGVPGGKALWTAIAAGDIHAGKFDLNKKWVPLYNIHKTYAGLRDTWLYTHNETAKQMLVKMSDWAIKLVSQLSDEQIQDMLRSEQGGLNEVFADVAAITGDKKYLALAEQFSHRAILDPLLAGEDKLTGLHANTQIPKVIGFQRIAELEGNTDWTAAADFFWRTVVENRSVSIGGNSANEQFHDAHDFTRMITGIQGPETCNTYNMLRLSKMLYENSLDKKYINYYERALYNHILSTQEPENGGLVYFTPMRPGHYRVYSQVHTSMWCCVGSGMENHSKYGELIYAHQDDALFVNLFIPSKLHWKEHNTNITQENHFPDISNTQFLIEPAQATTFTLHLRYPEWVEPGKLQVSVNGKVQQVEPDEQGYVQLKRRWAKGDRVVLELPMHLEADQLPDSSNYYAFRYGPFVLAARYGKEDLKGLYADAGRKAHVAEGKRIALNEVPILVQSDTEKLTTHVQPIDAARLQFKLAGLYQDGGWKEMTLEPFYGIHEERYIIYWPETRRDSLLASQQHTAEREQARAALDAVTLDALDCGEQQPESDHFIRYEAANTGYSESDGTHWRSATGWFSYVLDNRSGKARSLQVSYLDQDRPYAFDVLVNGVYLTTVSQEGKASGKLVELKCALPDTLQANEKLTLRFQAKQGKQTAKITGVRLLSVST